MCVFGINREIFTVHMEAKNNGVKHIDEGAF